MRRIYIALLLCCVIISISGFSQSKHQTSKEIEEMLNQLHVATTEKEKLEQVFNDWKLDLEQVDDVCVIGVRL